MVKANRVCISTLLMFWLVVLVGVALAGATVFVAVIVVLIL